MIKKLDILLIKSFVGPFIVTFFITLFILVMQFFWLYMDELIGKGLGLWPILQLLVLMSTTMVPLALPLGVLTGAIMSFGNLGENFELVAIKSSGISLNRFMQPLVIFIMLVSGVAFFFNNNVIPVANLKALSLLYDLRSSKPTFNLRAGQFNNDIQGYSIRIGEKDKDGRTIKDIIIYDQTGGSNNTTVTIAKEGMMLSTTDRQLLVFRLKDGWRYEEMKDDKGVRTQRRMHFGVWDKVFDLSSFKINKTNQDLFKNAYQMMNVAQLHVQIDSLNKNVSERLADNVKNYLVSYLTIISDDTNGKNFTKKLSSLHKREQHSYKNNFLETIPDSMKTKLVQNVINNNRNMKELISISVIDRKLQTDNLLKFRVEFHKKFTLSFACILLFLIGAPLGAIIRKGGIGMPMIVAVVFFLIWYIISIMGEKLAKAGSTPAWIGMWTATVMLSPIAFILIRQAKNDSQIFSKEWYVRIWQKMRKLLRDRKNK